MANKNPQMPSTDMRDAWAMPLMILVWGFAAGTLLWGSGIDVAIQVWLQDNYVQGFNDVMRVLGELGKGTAQIGICVALGVAWFVYGKFNREMDWQSIRYILLAIPVFAAAGVLNWILKFCIGRPRPKEFLMNGADPYHLQPFASTAKWWSFPSGHSCSTFAIAVWLGLAFPKYRWVFWAVGVVLSFSRFLALTPHYLGDVVTGAAVGTAVALLIWNVSQRNRRASDAS